MHIVSDKILALMRSGINAAIKAEGKDRMRSSSMLSILFELFFKVY
jgi:hypothetical protein